jgi:hypothetical protein
VHENKGADRVEQWARYLRTWQLESWLGGQHHLTVHPTENSKGVFMFRLLLGSGFALLDASATIASFVQGSNWALILLVSLVSSLVVMTMSILVDSILFENYFWDQETRSRANVARETTASRRR